MIPILTPPGQEPAGSDLEFWRQLLEDDQPYGILEPLAPDERGLTMPALAGAVKGNPYHDPETGRFASAPAGSGASAGAGTAGDGDTSPIGSSPVTSSRVLGSGFNPSYVVHFADGSKGVWKPLETEEGEAQGHSEVAAYRVGKLLGADVPPTNYMEFEGQVGTVQQWADGKLGVERPWNAPLPSQDSLDAIVAMDVVMHNTDRHGANYMVSEDGRAIAIDNGNSKWETWETSDKRPARQNALLNDYERDRDGSYDFEARSLDRWSKITRRQWDQALRGIDGRGTVNAANGWANLQYIIRRGRITWEVSRYGY